MIAFLNKFRSAVPIANPIPMIGPISGEMSIAPITTAVELTLSPKEATKIARISIHKGAPLKFTPSVICAIMLSSETLSGIILKHRLTNCHSVCLFFVSIRFVFGAKIMFICDIMVFWITIFFGSSVKWIDISHKLYKKKLVLCIFVVIKLQEHGYQHNAKPLRRLPTRPQNPRYEDNNLVLEIQTPKEKLCCPVCGSHNTQKWK